MQQGTIQDIKRKAIPILQEAGVTRAAIFGSVARGEQTEKSDVDLLIDVPQNMSLLGFVRLQQKLTDTLQKKVDLVDAAGIKPRLKPYIQQDQIAVF